LVSAASSTRENSFRMLRESKSMIEGLLVMKQSISVTVINVNINCKNGINMIFSPKTAFFTVGIAHTTPLYKGAEV
jgi:hypothetical protein